MTNIQTHKKYLKFLFLMKIFKIRCFSGLLEKILRCSGDRETDHTCISRPSEYGFKNRLKVPSATNAMFYKTQCKNCFMHFNLKI